MSTYQEIIELGYAKSSAARPATMAVSAELIARVNQCLREVYQVLSRENPFILGTRAVVDFDGSGWRRPVDCLRVIDVKADAGTAATPAITVGDEITVVPYQDQQIAEGVPCLTELGQSFIPTGQAIDPSGGSVTMAYARAPEQGDELTDEIDAMFPAFFDDILQCDIAAYLAEKDRRTEDQDTFTALKGAAIQQLIDWSRGQTYAIVQRAAIVNPPLTNSAGGRQQPTVR